MEGDASSSSNLSFLKKESYAMPEDMNVQLELARVRERFSNLKFNYIELETRQGFIENLSNENWRNHISGNTTQDLKQSIAANKDKIKQRKKELNSLKDNVQTVVDELFSNYDQFLKISQELSELNKVETEENVRFNSVAEKLHPKLKLNKMDTQEECDLVINQSQVEIDKIASEIESMQQEFERLENELKRARQRQSQS